MAKKIDKLQNKPSSITPAEDTGSLKPNAHSPIPNHTKWYLDFKVHAALVAILAIAFYWNTFKHDFALDDTVVIVGNEFVHEGFAGIPDILTKDAYYSYFNRLKSTNQLSGGRYRPLSIVTFAIEQQFFGAMSKGNPDSILTVGLDYEMKRPFEKRFLHEMHIRHIFNVAWYALAVVALLYFLRYVVFKSNPLMALLAAILFTIHPLHTEVVANVKSRDEIMSILFICLTFVCAFKYREHKDNKWWLFAALASFFLAFLSKEYAITLALLLPLSFYLFNKDTIKNSLMASLPYYAVVLVYLMIRWNVIGPRNELSDSDIQINPYAYASGIEKMTTVIATSLNYLKLLIFPHPLSSDYSYNQIPYKTISSPLVWLSVLVHGGLFFGIVYFFRKRSVLCFALAFYVLNLLMVNNFLFDIGATMGERLIFHSSVGFAIAVAYLLYSGLEKISSVSVRGIAMGCILIPVILLCGFKTMQRNRDWKNDETLFFKDVNVSPNSFLVNVNVGTMLVNRSDLVTDQKQRVYDLHRGIDMFSRVIAMQDNYVLGYMNRSIGYLKLAQPDSMLMDLERVRAIYPIHPTLPEMYYNDAMLYLSGKNYVRAAEVLGIALKLVPNDPYLKKALNDVNAAAAAQSK